MANLNKVMLIGRLTRKPEPFTSPTGWKVVKFGFAVNNRVKNQQTGEWEEKPVFIDVKAFNRENGRKLADLVEQYLDKGHQCYIEGHLVMEEWDDKDTGKKRSMLRVILEDLQFLEPRTDGGGPRATSNTPARTQQQAPARMAAPAPSGYDDNSGPSNGGHQEEEIPF
jgi:single-strand DNA-binding protein